MGEDSIVFPIPVFDRNRNKAVLYADGRMQLDDGRSAKTPSEAATMVTGRANVSGWKHWFTTITGGRTLTPTESRRGGIPIGDLKRQFPHMFPGSREGDVQAFSSKYGDPTHVVQTMIGNLSLRPGVSRPVVFLRDVWRPILEGAVNRREALKRLQHTTIGASHITPNQLVATEPVPGQSLDTAWMFVFKDVVDSNCVDMLHMTSRLLPHDQSFRARIGDVSTTPGAAGRAIICSHQRPDPTCAILSGLSKEAAATLVQKWQVKVLQHSTFSHMKWNIDARQGEPFSSSLRLVGTEDGHTPMPLIRNSGVSAGARNSFSKAFEACHSKVQTRDDKPRYTIVSATPGPGTVDGYNTDTHNALERACVRFVARHASCVYFRRYMPSQDLPSVPTGGSRYVVHELHIMLEPKNSGVVEVGRTVNE